MKILICHNKGMARHEVSMHAFALGMIRCGHSVRQCFITDFRKHMNTHINLVVIFGSGVLGRGGNAEAKYNLLHVCETYRIPHVKLEEAFIKRGTYWAVTIDGLAGDGEYIHNDMDPNRIDKITKFKPFEWSGSAILLAKQLERDANVGVPPAEYRDWVKDMIEEMSDLTYPLIVRDHPKERPSKESIEKVLEYTRMVVTFTSTTAVDAAISGIPFYVEHPRSVVYELSVQEMDGELPSYEDQRWILNEVAHAQWTTAEMESGDCWEHLKQLETIKTL